MMVMEDMEMEQLLEELKNLPKPRRADNAARLLIEEVKLGFKSRLQIEKLRREFGLPIDDPLEGVSFYGDKRSVR